MVIQEPEWKQFIKNFKKRIKTCQILNNYLPNFQHNKNLHPCIQMYKHFLYYHNHIQSQQILTNRQVYNHNKSAIHIRRRKLPKIKVWKIC